MNRNLNKRSAHESANSRAGLLNASCVALVLALGSVPTQSFAINPGVLPPIIVPMQSADATVDINPLVGDDFVLFGFERNELKSCDRWTTKSASLPGMAYGRFQVPYDIHKRLWGPPRTTLTWNGKQVFFVKKRDGSEGAAAFYGNQMPSFWSSADPTCLRPEAGGGWCSANGSGIVLHHEYASSRYSSLLLSHEMVHAKQDEWLGKKASNLPFWMLEGQANGWGYGMVEVGETTRRAMALRLAQPDGNKGDAVGTTGLFSFFLGLRPYDQPLDVNDHAFGWPKAHPDYPEKSAAATAPANSGACNSASASSTMGSHVAMASYMTGSFFRHMLRERPGGAIAVRHMMTRPVDAGQQSLDEWLDWMDKGLKSATIGWRGERRPIWRGGIRDVLTETIVGMADFPDIVAKSRSGLLARDAFDARIWSQGCIEIDLSVATAWQGEVKIQPLAARCLRVKVDPEKAGTAGPEILAGNAAPPPLDTSPPWLSVTASTNTDFFACKDMELGSRGQIIGNAILANPKNPSASSPCTISWSVPYKPWHPNRAGGLKGYQNVILVNAADDAMYSVERTMTVSIVRPVVRGTISGSATPEGGGKPRKPLPKPAGGDEDQPAPQIRPVEEEDPSEVCEPDDRAIFKCGPRSAFSFSTGEAAKIATLTHAGLIGTTLQYLPGDHVTLGDEVAGAMAGAGQQMTRYLQAGAGPPGMKVDVVLPRLAPGQTGTFPARVDVAWSDGSRGGAGNVDSLKPGRTRRDASNCLVVETYQTDATVTISANTAGFVLGALSARLYEPNPDEDPASTCARPIDRIGEIQLSFSSPSVIFIGEHGSHEVDLSRIEKHGQIMTDWVAQIGIPAEQRSDILPGDLEEAMAERGGGSGSGSGRSGGGNLKCAAPSAQDIEDFAKVMAATALASGADPAEAAELEATIKGQGFWLGPSICLWISQGRPATYALEEPS